MDKKVWLITGSSRGLGRALAEAVLEAGHFLVATVRNVSSLNDLKEKYVDQILVAELDVTNEQQAINVIKTTFDKLGRLDVIVNNAGYGNLNSIEETTMTDFRQQVETNLFGTVIVTKAALPKLREQGFGHIIQISSVGGRIGPIGRGAYAAAKWGVEGFSETLSKEVAPLGIKVTIVEPGGFRTDFAGTSTTIEDGLPAYDTTVGKAARFQRDYSGKQPGDPRKASKAIIHITTVEEPPLRLLLGKDAVNGVAQNDIAKTEADKKWREISLSTDFE